MPQMKEQGKTPKKKNPYKTKKSILLNKEFKETVIRMVNKLENTMEKLREHINNKIQNVKKNQSEMNNS